MVVYPYESLEVARQENLVWVKNIPDEIIYTATIQRIPSQRIFSTAEGLLYAYGKLMPLGDLPNLAWLPLQEGLRVELPAINPNFFGVQERVSLQLVPRSSPAKAVLILVSLADLEQYLKAAAAWRLEALDWTVIGNYHALLKGTPMATVTGKPYWQRGQHILPLGLDLQWPILAKASAKHLDPTGQHWIFWQKNGQYGLLPKTNFKPLRRSSFYRTKTLLNSSSL